MLESQLEAILADTCKNLGCRETMTGNGQDYLGCQYQTNSGYTCQNWLEQTPQSHSYIPEWYPDGHLGDHNFCRNPDGDSTIWCTFALQLAVCFAPKIWICAERIWTRLSCKIDSESFRLSYRTLAEIQYQSVSIVQFIFSVIL